MSKGRVRHHSFLWCRRGKEQELQVHAELRVATTNRVSELLPLCVGYGVYCPPRYFARHETWNLYTSDCHWVRIPSKQTCFPEHNPLGTLFKHDRNAGLEAHAWHPSTRWGWKQRGLGVQGQSQLYTKSEISLSYMRFCLKTNFKKYWQDGLSDKAPNWHLERHKAPQSSTSAFFIHGKLAWTRPTDPKMSSECKVKSKGLHSSY